MAYSVNFDKGIGSGGRIDDLKDSGIIQLSASKLYQVNEKGVHENLISGGENSAHYGAGAYMVKFAGPKGEEIHWCYSIQER